ncbi:MAG: GFA family protein [Nevskia sp.]|nr:GFA family protein [Nevskia sp.]
MNDQVPIRATGRCLCGGVTFSIVGPLRSTVTACHCNTCRRFTGGLWAGTVARREHVRIAGDSLKWYQSSAEARRAFCGNCGSSLFWDGQRLPFLSIAAGALDPPTGLRLACHGWTSEAADYWSFDAGLPLRPGPSGLGPPE